ncbi:hypothetical protein HPB51_023134 [Rhipicephalus microplus]|uniref:Ig-like domain-containing protein n=1 Tax=Rhipicephalus microplus TaxID=6941 RepID=A0A9J6DK87_RHIMP|nr:hypothetical protein HPB51_023134 [Rhipicephalus microplus]
MSSTVPPPRSLARRRTSAPPVRDATSGVEARAGTCAASTRLSPLAHARTREPKVQPFHFPKTVLRGEKVRVVCSAASGATPLSFQWLRDGQRLSDGAHHVSIKTFDDFSVLEVANVGVAHNGNYTCALKNLQGNDAYSSQLLVQAAPEWVTKPRDTSSALNGPASLDCLAVGYPTPTVRWSREETVSDDVELRPVPLGGARVSLLANGTLAIREVRKEDAGRYRCVASNGLGQGPGRHAHALASR